MGTYVILPNMLSIVYNNKPYMVSDDHIHYDEILEHVRNDNFYAAIELINVTGVITRFTGSKVYELSNNKFVFEVNDYQIKINGKEVNNALVDLIIRMHKNGDEIDPLIAFYNNLLQNPSHRAVNELYGWLEANEMFSITDDGHFLAYKKIRYNWTDIHTGRFDNSIGQIVEMERNEVDNDKDRTCSNGLHFCSYDYLKHFGSNDVGQCRVVILKINPRDVVSIPTDYNNSKGRCCKYEVVDECKEWKEKEYFEAPVTYAIGNVTFTNNLDLSYDDYVDFMEDLLGDEDIFLNSEYVNLWNNLICRAYLDLNNIKKFRDKSTAYKRVSKFIYMDRCYNIFKVKFDQIKSNFSTNSKIAIFDETLDEFLKS